MPAKNFICPDGGRIPIDTCLTKRGCRMTSRCASLPYLRLVGYDREWRGVTPSAAGNGPRLLFLKATCDYDISPNDRAFSALGVSVHGKLSIHKYTSNVLSEEPLSDDEAHGIADLLEEDEWNNGNYILQDYKTAGSYKVAQWLGLVKEKKEIPVVDKDGNPVLLKSGPNKGKPKTKTETSFKIDLEKIDIQNEEFQLNRYRIFFESYGFPISHMYINAIVRDGGIKVAQSRGLAQNIYRIPVKRLADGVVLSFYRALQEEVDMAFKNNYIRLCDKHESWNKRRCESYCEVRKQCDEMGE